MLWSASHSDVSASVCRIDSRALYPCDSYGSTTSLVVTPCPLSAACIRSLCRGKVPALLSASPCIKSTGLLILCADIKGAIVL